MRVLRTHNTRLKNKRIRLAYDDKKDTFILTFVRLIEPNENIKEIQSTANIEIIKNKIVQTSIEITKQSGIAIISNFKLFFKDLENGMFPDFYKQK